LETRYEPPPPPPPPPSATATAEREHKFSSTAVQELNIDRTMYRRKAQRLGGTAVVHSEISNAVIKTVIINRQAVIVSSLQETDGRQRFLSVTMHNDPEY